VPASANGRKGVENSLNIQSPFAQKCRIASKKTRPFVHKERLFAPRGADLYFKRQSSGRTIYSGNFPFKDGCIRMDSYRVLL